VLESLEGKVALITGAGRGIGRAIALALASQGCSLAICANVKDEIDKVADEIEQLGAKVLALCLDLSRREDCVLFVKKTLDRYGTVDFLINCAGVIFQKPLLEQSLEEWDTTMNVNLRSYFILTQEVLKIMKEKRDGYIINIASTAVQGPRGDLVAYGVSKYGVQGLSRTTYDASVRYGFGVRVSTIYPGAVDTSMARSLDFLKDEKNWILPEDIAEAVVFLLTTPKRVLIRDLVVENCAV